MQKLPVDLFAGPDSPFVNGFFGMKPLVSGVVKWQDATRFSMESSGFLAIFGISKAMIIGLHGGFRRIFAGDECQELTSPLVVSTDIR